MKKLFYLPLLILIINCSRFGQDPAEIVEPVPSYMKELSTGNKDCIPQPSLGFTVGQVTYANTNVSYDNYTDQSFPNFDVNHGIFYLDTNKFYEMFPSFPAVNSTLVLNDANYTIKETHAKWQITSNLPKSYLNNLKTGSYVLNNDDYAKHTLGFNINLAVVCSLYEDANNSFCALYKIDLKKAYHFKINCVDKSDPANVKISGQFEGTFVPNIYGDDNSNLAESKFIKGNFSYIFR